MGDFSFYFKTGWRHIISWNAMDHLLFILALAAIYLLKNWKQVLVLVTAFTIGHSLTLALSIYNIVRVNDKWVEFLIPCTIIITAVFNILQKIYDTGNLRLNYFFALFFGLIHGLGFANTIRFMMARDQSIGWSLLSFNLGLEAGQIVVVLFILLISFVIVDKLNFLLNQFITTRFTISRKWWIWGLSFPAFAIAVKMALARWPF
jgi:HupE / UreJ protein